MNFPFLFYIFPKDQAVTFLGLSELGFRDQTCSLIPLVFKWSRDSEVEIFSWVTQGQVWSGTISDYTGVWEHI